jgi:hypothetical protein
MPLQLPLLVTNLHHELAKKRPGLLLQELLPQKQCTMVFSGNIVAFVSTWIRHTPHLVTWFPSLAGLARTPGPPPHRWLLAHQAVQAWRITETRLWIVLVPSTLPQESATSASGTDTHASRWDFLLGYGILSCNSYASTFCPSWPTCIVMSCCLFNPVHVFLAASLLQPVSGSLVLHAVQSAPISLLVRRVDSTNVFSMPGIALVGHNAQPTPAQPSCIEEESIINLAYVSLRVCMYMYRRGIYNKLSLC